MRQAASYMLHARTPAILGANLVNSTILAVCFAGEIDPRVLWTWYAALLLSVAGRTAAWYGFRDQRSEGWESWQRAAIVGSSISGTLWGLAGVLLYEPQSVALATLTAFVLGGMAAGALALLTAHLLTFRLYVLLSLLPFCMRLVWEGGAMHLGMAAMFLTYMIAILVVGPQMHRAIIESLTLRFENGRLLRDLEDRVDARTARHARVVDFSQHALSGVALDQLFEEAARIVRDGLSVQGALIMELVSGNEFVVRASSGPPGDGRDEISLGETRPEGTRPEQTSPEGTSLGEMRFSAEPDFLATRAIRRGVPLVVEDFAHDPTLKPCPPLRGRDVRSALSVPIVIDGRAHAVLEAWSAEPRSIAVDDVHFVRSVATTIAAAVQRRRAEKDAQRLALHDPLTALPNRKLFREDLARSLSRALRSGRRAGVLLIDLDNFKDVNDTLGHPVGDLLLVKAAERLRSVVRREESPARLGGDEFALVLPELSDADAAAAVAGHIVAAFAQSFDLEGQIVQLGASVGIAMFPDDGEDPDQLLRNADLALYRAKARGRGGFEFYAEDMSSLVEARMKLAGDLRAAIDREEFTLLFQPQIALADGRVAGLEALLRWRTASRGDVAPADFIPVAETNGLMATIDNWAIAQACRHASGWADPGLLTTINLSLAQWRRRDMFPALERTLTTCGCDLSRLGLEITERAFPVTGDGELVESIGRLRALGISISIDDFGTGYLNLSRLRRLPVDRIKIDPSFVAGIGCDLGAESIVRVIITLGRDLGLEVVAEGVETAEQLDFLGAEGCGFAQGNYLAPPTTAEAIAEKLGMGTPGRAEAAPRS